MSITQIVDKYTDHDDKFNKELKGYSKDLKKDLEEFTKEVIIKCAKTIFDCNWELTSSDDNILLAIDEIINENF